MTATLNPTVKTFTERHELAGGRDVTLTSTLNLTDDAVAADPADRRRRDAVGPAYAKVTLGAAALSAAASRAASSTAYNSPTVDTGVGSGTTVTATGDVTVKSNIFQLAESTAVSIAARARRRHRHGRRRSRPRAAA